MIRSLILITLLSGCSQLYPQEIEIFSFDVVGKQTINIANEYVGMDERNHRKELKEFMKIDPLLVEWCAAFVNSVLQEQGFQGSESVSSAPLLARSFMYWGEKVEDEPQRGDVIVFPRGSYSWQGHVGFYFDTVLIDGVEYYMILGGNQDNKVSFELYPAERSIAVRRAKISNDV